MKQLKGEYTVKISFAHSFIEDTPYHLEGPVVSMYFNTHRLSSNFKIDQKSFKNHLKTVKSKLKDITDTKVSARIMEPLEELLVDTSFWIYNQDACAIFVNEKECVIFRLVEPIIETIVVSDSIYIKPLVRLNQRMDHYFILGLSKDSFEVFEVYNNKIEPFVFEDTIAKTLKEVLGEDKTESFITHGNYSHVSNRGTFHGHGGQKEETDIDTEKFFRYVDKTVSTHVSSLQSLPVVLCSLNKNQQMYRRYAKDTNLLKQGIDTSFESISLDEIKQMADDIILKENTKRYQTLQQQAKAALASNRYSDQINEIIKSIHDEAIEKLFIEEDQKLIGVIDKEKQVYEYISNDNDVYDDLAEMCLKRKIPIYILPRRFMPTTTHIFAVINK